MLPSRGEADFARRGLLWMTAGLLVFLAADLGVAILILSLAPTALDVMEGRTPPGAVSNPLGVASLAYAIAQSAAGVVFLIGLADLWSGRFEAGEDHARSVALSRPYFAVAILLAFLAVFVPSPTGLALSLPITGATLPGWTVTSGILLAGVRALFAGLGLFVALQGLADASERPRLLLGMVLGVVGGVAWPGILAYGAETSATAQSLVDAIVASVLAGLGTSVISLASFALAAHHIRRRMNDGAQGQPARSA